jgi:succinate-acetate transporter protein
MSDVIDQAEKYIPEHLERQRTSGGHYNDRTQPGLPIIHRTFASPAPLGLLSFATSKPQSSR